MQFLYEHGKCTLLQQPNQHFALQLSHTSTASHCTVQTSHTLHAYRFYRSDCQDNDQGQDGRGVKTCSTACTQDIISLSISLMTRYNEPNMLLRFLSYTM